MSDYYKFEIMWLYPNLNKAIYQLVPTRDNSGIKKNIKTKFGLEEICIRLSNPNFYMLKHVM